MTFCVRTQRDYGMRIWNIMALKQLVRRRGPIIKDTLQLWLKIINAILWGTFLDLNPDLKNNIYTNEQDLICILR